MRICNLEMSLLEIPFRTSFKHASADRSKTASVWVAAAAGDGTLLGYGEGCPRAYVTGEDGASALSFFNRNRESIIRDITSLASLQQWEEVNEDGIDANPAAWCAIELAVLDLLGRSQGQTFEEMLSLPGITGQFRYSAVLGDSPAPVFEKQVRQYLRTGFDDFKIKLSGDFDSDLQKIACLKSSGPGLRIRADANNLWDSADEVVAYFMKLGQPFWAVEEPLRPKDFSGLGRIADELGIKVILDESCTRADDLQGVAGNPGSYVLNLRVSKLGGLIRSLRLLKRARAQGHQVIVGAHVGETSVLTRAGLTLGWAASDIRLALEGAFGTHLLETDICEPPVMFGEGGILSAGMQPFSGSPGNGLQIC
jgi:L-alanine-DL-glutamate epimerase-like enolase superfamily enzyme